MPPDQSGAAPGAQQATRIAPDVVLIPHSLHLTNINRLLYSLAARQVEHIKPWLIRRNTLVIARYGLGRTPPTHGCPLDSGHQGTAAVIPAHPGTTSTPSTKWLSLLWIPAFGGNDGGLLRGRRLITGDKGYHASGVTRQAQNIEKSSCNHGTSVAVAS